MISKAISNSIADDFDFVISLSRTTVNTYAIARGKSIHLSEILFTPLRFIASLLLGAYQVVVFFFATITLIILTIAMIITLCFGNLIFLISKGGDVKSIDRKSLINKHLRVENSLRSLEQMRSSKFLFKTPIIGALNRAFYRNIKDLELQLRNAAYPQLGTIPTDITIHELDPSDPWQDDLDKYSESEILTLQ